MMTSKDLIEKTLLKEGGYCNVPGDSGGMTYKGIAYNYDKDWEGWKIVKAHLPLKRGAYIKDDKLDQMVIEYYEKKYYKPSKCDLVNSPIIKAHLYDMGVNAGKKTSAKLLQQAVNNVYKADLVVDGVIGPKSLEYINKEEKLEELENAFADTRKAYYKKIGTGVREKFLRGWLARADDITSWARTFK